MAGACNRPTSTATSVQIPKSCPGLDKCFGVINSIAKTANRVVNRFYFEYVVQKIAII